MLEFFTDVNLFFFLNILNKSLIIKNIGIYIYNNINNTNANNNTNNDDDI